MRPSGKFFWIIVAVAGLLTALLFLAIEEVQRPATSLLISNLTQTAIVLWAALCSLHVARKSSAYLRQLWLLLAAALFLGGAAQALETYYQSFAHAPSLTPWPSDILFMLWVTPAAMMLLPRPEKDSGTVDWLQVLDFAQIGVVALTAYLYFFYIPSRWEAEGPQMVVKIMRLQMLRDAALAGGFVIRVITAAEGAVRSFFRRMAGFFVLATTSGVLHLLAPYTSRSGARWTDIIFCMPFLFVALVAAGWNREQEPVLTPPRSRVRTIMVSQALPILIPLLVLFMGRRIAAEQITIAWIAVTASFVLSGARLVLTNEKQRRIAEDLFQTKQALARSEHIFLTAFRSSPDAVGISTMPGGQFLEVNDGFTRLTGYLREEVLGKTAGELNLWKDPTRRAEVFAKLLDKSEVRDQEFVCITKAGETRITQFSGTLIQLDGRPCALAIVRDITERKLAEEALRASEERFRNLVRDLHVGVVLLGHDAETKFANRAALEMFGLREEEARGKSTAGFEMVAIREDGTEIPFERRPGPRAIATKKPIRNEMVGWRRESTDEVLWTLVDAVPHLTSDGKVANVILSISDVTLWKQAEEALRSSEERFRTLVRDFNVGVVVLGPDARVQFANQAAEEMFGITLAEARGKDTSQLSLTSIREDGTEVPYAMRPGPLAVKTGQTFRNEVIGWRRRGSSEILWTMGNVVPQFAQDGSVAASINTFINITERKQAEEALHQLSTRLLQLQDEERRRLGRELHDSLAQSVLAVNLNLAQATRSMTSKDESARSALAEARRVLSEMSREIRTLSYLLHPPLLDELGLASALREYAEGFGERSGIKLDLEIQSGFGRLPQEAETALFRIVQESLANIQRHSGSQTAEIHLRGDGASVDLEIRDRGRGMNGKAIERGSGSGTRLGVGILGMRERMTQLGGKLEIESSPSGTTVRVSIPLRTEVPDASSHSRSR
ncbi:MAG TPA: PAS domain S-box protein [Candidatus Acidoferrum sp.]|nr:PAS domain S-box protein [Candidatus Acidoferrum sp.]